MAFVATLTGTGRNCTLTSGSATMTVSSNTGLVVGATIQGTGIPAGTKINSISGTTVVMSANASTGGTQSLIFSSVYGSTLTIQLTASGDVATWQNVFNAGYGLLLGTKNLFHPGALTVTFGSIVAGARFDHENWTVEYGTGGRQLFDSGLLAGEQRGGYDIAGSLLIKSAGPTFIFTSWNNASPGGSSMFLNTGNALTQGGTFRMHNPRFVLRSGSANAAFAFTSVRDNMIVENLILDYSEAGGSNASIGIGYGTVLNPKIVFSNSGLARTNANAIGNVIGLQFLGLFTDSPNAKFAIPNNYVMEGYAPQVTSAQSLGGFQSNSTETFANIDLTSPGWGLNDLKTKYFRFGGTNVINFPRRVTFEFNDSTGANLTGVTLYISSGANTVINAVQAGDYSANTQALVLTWNTTTGAYRVANIILDTISQTAQVRKYGYIQQTTSYSLNTAPYSQPFFMLTDTALAGISEATAAAITTAGINWSTKTITPTADLSYDQINARIAWELAQTTNSAQADPRTIVGSNLTLATGWSLVVNTGRTISSGTAITYLFVPTVTLVGTGKITAVYASNAGTSTTWRFEDVEVGSSLVIYDSSGVTKYFQQEVTSAGDYSYYIAPGTTGTYTWAIEKYGTRRESGTFAANTGGLLFYVPAYAEDVGITQATKATVAAYTALETNSKVYDYVAYKRLSENFIKIGQITTRSGTSIEWIAGYDVLIKSTNASVFSLTGTTFYIKSSSLAGDTKYSTNILVPPATMEADTTEVITTEIEDGNGDSSITVSASSVSTFEVWKITDATDPDDYATGTLVDTIGIGKWRFLHDDGYKFVIRDQTTNYRVVVEAEKGIYEAQLFFGAAVQLAQAAEVSEINTKVDIMQIDLEAIKGTGHVKDVHSLTNIKKKAALAAALSA
jgi:hypothetical protein